MPSADAPPESSPASPSFADRLRRGWESALDHLPLAVVPLLSSLLAADNVRRASAFDGLHFGVAFRFPSALPDLWTFVSLPNQGPGVHVSPSLVLLPVLVVARAALVAGLLGSVHRAVRTGGYDFAANARRYFVPMLVFEALVQVLGFAALAVGVAALPLVLLLVPLFVVSSYLFYAAPYLIAVADCSVGEALARSYDWALDGGPYFAYGAGYLLFVAATSIVATAVVVNLGVVGVVVGATASAPVALALTFATTEFVADASDDAVGRDGSDDGDSGTADDEIGSDYWDARRDDADRGDRDADARGDR